MTIIFPNALRWHCLKVMHSSALRSNLHHRDFALNFSNIFNKQLLIKNIGIAWSKLYHLFLFRYYIINDLLYFSSLFGWRLMIKTHFLFWFHYFSVFKTYIILHNYNIINKSMIIIFIIRHIYWWSCILPDNLCISSRLWCESARGEQQS